MNTISKPITKEESSKTAQNYNAMRILAACYINGFRSEEDFQYAYRKYNEEYSEMCAKYNLKKANLTFTTQILTGEEDELNDENIKIVNSKDLELIKDLYYQLNSYKFLLVKLTENDNEKFNKFLEKIKIAQKNYDEEIERLDKIFGPIQEINYTKNIIIRRK